jgi:hypothetical protein
VTVTESANLAQFRERRDFASLYQRIKDDSSPEALYLRAELYARCASREDKPDKSAQAAERKKNFMASILPTDSNAQRRIDSYEKLSADPCAGLVMGKFNEQTLDQMLTVAAKAGDPRAQARQLAQDIEGVYHAQQRSGATPRGYDLSEEDFNRARSLLASGDPNVMQDLQGILSSTLTNATVMLNGEPVEPHAMNAAFALSACVAGARCGPDSPQLLANCAQRGQCDARTLYEYTYYYVASPSQAQLIDRYYNNLVSMTRANDFYGLTFSRNAGSPGFSMVFGGRRGG